MQHSIQKDKMIMMKFDLGKTLKTTKPVKDFKYQELQKSHILQ